MLNDQRAVSELQGPVATSLSFAHSVPSPSFYRQQFHVLLGLTTTPTEFLELEQQNPSPSSTREPENTPPLASVRVQPGSASRHPSPRNRRHPWTKLEARRLCAQGC